MTLNEAIYRRLSNNAAVSAIVGTAIFPDQAPQDSFDPPFIVWMETDRETAMTLGGASGASHVELRFYLVGTTRAQTHLMGKAMRNALIQWADSLSGVQSCVYLRSDEDFQQEPDSSEAGRYLTTQDYAFWVTDE